MEQGSTPGQNVGAPASPQAPADNAGLPVQPSQQPAQAGDLLGRLQESQATGEPAAAPPSQVETPSQPTTPPQQGPENQGQPAGDSGVDADLQRWAQSQNLNLNTETEIALAKRLRDTQKWAHQQNTQKFNEVTQQLADNGGDAVEASVNQMANKFARMEFFLENPEAKAMEPAMVDYVIKLHESGDVQGAAYYASNWNQLYTLVKAEQAANPFTQDQLTDEARRTERENLARAQQSAPPSSAATSSAPRAAVTTDEMIANMSQAEYNEWRKTNNPFSLK